MAGPLDRDASAFHHGRHRWLSSLNADRKMTGSARAVAIAIWDRMNAEKGCAWPSLSYFERVLGFHRQTIVRAIALLVDRGWLAVERGNRQRSNRYRLAFGSPEDRAKAAAGSRRTSPRHGTQGNGRVYIQSGTPEWTAYAEDFRNAHSRDPQPHRGGRWFNIAGENAQGSRADATRVVAPVRER
jgi:hypothetical protein